MKRAAVVFLAIIIGNLVLSYIFAAACQNAGFNTSDFWPTAIFDVVMYAVYFLIFFVVVRWGTPKPPVKELFSEYKLSRKVKPVNAVLMVVIAGVMVCSYLLVQYASVDVFKLFGGSVFKKNLASSGIVIDNPVKYLVCIVTVCLLPAVVEELVFRGLVLSELKKYGAVAAIIGSAVLFSLYHMNPAQTVYQFIMGIIFALVVIRGGNLVYSMILHFINNFIIVTYTFVIGSGEVLMSWNVLTAALTVGLAVMGSLVIWGLVKVFFKKDAGTVLQRKRFLNFDNLGYLVCVVAAGALWIAILSV